MSLPNRNDPCPCGSGKKYKKCCLAKAVVPNASGQSIQPASQDYNATNVVPPTELLLKAVALHQAGQLDEAQAAYQILLKESPNDSDALHYLGLIAFQNSEYSEAAHLIEQAIKFNGNVPAFHFNLGNAYKRLKQPDSAVEAYLAAIRLDPAFLKAHLNLGNTLKDQGNLDAAIESYRHVLLLKPDYAEALNNLGLAFQAQGNPDAAVENYRKALSLKADYPEACNNLGATFYAQGKFEAAIESYRQALLLRPDYAEAHNNLGLAFQAQGNLDAADETFRKALSFKPNYAEASFNLGNTLRVRGKYGMAIEHYKNALLAKPDYAEAHYCSGIAYQSQSNYDAAIKSFQKALSLKPDYAEAHNNMGIALRDQGMLDLAVASFQKALSLRPDYADAHVGMAYVNLDFGQFDAARAALSRALEYKPEYPFAWAALTLLKKMTPEDHEWLNTALRLISEGNSILSEKEIYTLQFAIGKYYDDTGQFDSAFSAYSQANKLKRKSESIFDRADLSRLVDDLIATYTRELISQQAKGGSQSRRPVLIVGMPRSGTSLVEQIIASHPEAFGAGELNFWASQANANQIAVLSGKYDFAFTSRIASEYEQLLQQYSIDATRIVDKMPTNFLRLGLITKVFPQAKIIHTQRNPLDTCLSIHFADFNAGYLYASDFEDLAFYFREYARLMHHWRSVLLPDQFLEVQYEALVDDPSEWSRRIIEFLGLEWDERCLDFHKKERAVGTASNWQVRQKIYKSSKARWRNYEKHLGPLLGLLDLGLD